MKPIDQYPTPITDAAQFTTGMVAGSVARNLERKLAACREFIRDTAKTSSSSRIRREASQVFQLTEP